MKVRSNLLIINFTYKPVHKYLSQYLLISIIDLDQTRSRVPSCMALVMVYRGSTTRDHDKHGCRGNLRPSLSKLDILLLRNCMRCFRKPDMSLAPACNMRDDMMLATQVACGVFSNFALQPREVPISLLQISALF